MEGHGDLQLGRDHQQHRIGAIARTEREARKAAGVVGVRLV